MSTRPTGPSTRPFAQQFPFQHARNSQYEQLPQTFPFHANEAPRLKERSVLSRLFCCTASIVCIMLVFFAISAAFKAISGETWSYPFAANDYTYNTAPPPKKTLRHQLRQKSIIKRLSMLRRSEVGNGVDLKWTRQLFPQWFVSDEDKLDPQATLADLVLAVSFLIQAELEE